MPHSITLWLLNRVDNMQVHGSKTCRMNQGGITTMELVSPLHLLPIPVRPEHCVLKQRNGKRMAYFSTVSKHVVALRAIVVTEANVIQPCVDPVQSPSRVKQANNLKLLLLQNRISSTVTKTEVPTTLMHS